MGNDLLTRSTRHWIIKNAVGEYLCGAPWDTYWHKDQSEATAFSRAIFARYLISTRLHGDRSLIIDTTERPAANATRNILR